MVFTGNNRGVFHNDRSIFLGDWSLFFSTCETDSHRVISLIINLLNNVYFKQEACERDISTCQDKNVIDKCIFISTSLELMIW